MTLPTLDQGLGIFFAATGIGILLFLAGKVGFLAISFFGFSFQRAREKTPAELAYEREDRKAAAEVEHRQIDVAFVRYSEAAVGMGPMLEATGPANESLTAWFDVVAGALAAALTKFPEDHYRVAIWADLGDPASFRLLGSANHDLNATSMATLSKAGTIAGLAWRSKNGEYLCSDILKDKKYKARSGTSRPYRSILAVRLGRQSWGVMTVDAPRTDGFGPTDLAIARRFALLVSAGAVVAAARYGPLPARQLPAPVGEQPRIVAPAGAGMGDQEVSDGQP